MRLLEASKNNYFRKLLANDFKFKGYDIDILDNDGKCPLAYAILHQNIEFVEFLIK